MSSNASPTVALPVRARPLVFGVVLFLASELMFFAGLFASYFALRGASGTWPPPGVHLDRVESSIGTAVLALSSFTMVLFARSLARQNERIARRWLLATLGSAIAFLAIALHGWLKNGFSVGSHAYGTIFYTMTGFHALHVAAGAILIAVLVVGLQRPAFRSVQQSGAEAIVYYWHFVFIVWLAIWGTVYWIR